MTFAKTRFYQRLNTSLQGLLSTEGVTIAATDPVSGTLQSSGTIKQTDYVNVREVPNVRLLALGTDNFGRDVTAELVSATGTSLVIGIVAGLIATTIGLVLGLAAGYIGGVVDDVIMFFTNLFTVIPTIVILILVSYSIGQEKRGPVTIAVVIGFTAWVLDCQGGTGAGDLSAQPRPCEPVEAIGAPYVADHLHRYSALHRIVCLHGADPANFHGDPV